MLTHPLAAFLFIGIEIMQQINYEQHPLSASFPKMSDDEYSELVLSIESQGLLNPIIIFGGMVIDGWHRYCACKDTGTAIKTIEYNGNDPQAFVIAQNKLRRHLSAGQIAAATISVYKWKSEGRPNNCAAVRSFPKSEFDTEKSAKEMADEAGVSQRSIVTAKKVARENPDAFEKVKSGEMSLYAAANSVKSDAKESDEPEYSEIDHLKNTISELNEIIQEMRVKIAIGSGGDNAEFELLINELKAENKALKSNLGAVTKSRDLYLSESNQRLKQIRLLESKIKKLEKQ